MVPPRIASSSNKGQHGIIEDVRVGRSKESVDSVGDHSLLVADVVSCFSRFVKYNVKSDSPAVDERPTIDAFQIMRQAQRSHSFIYKLPPPLMVRNK